MLTTSYLVNANLSHADLKGASFKYVDFTGANLTGANLMDISCDQFTLISLAKAKLDGAAMNEKLRSDLVALSGSDLGP